MCGITGFLDYGPSRSPDEMLSVAVSMSGTLAHRGPDDAGTWIDAGAGIAFGHTRLAIVDLSAEGHQPMHSSSGGWVLSYNGEVYNHGELRTELERGGVRFRGTSDTEVVVEAIARWGVRTTLERMNGMFAFALWDRAERVLHLARDRVGEKPLYYGWMGRTLVFGSELKSLRRHPAFDATLDRDALTLYLRYNYVPSPYTIFRNVAKLPPGTLLSVPAASGSARPVPSAYWSLADVVRGARAQTEIGADEAIDELDALLRSSVGMRMIADVPVGAFLSGGIDSTTVVAMMQTLASQPVRTFTIGFRESGFDEAEPAAAVARHLGTEHTELYVSPREAQDVIPRLPSTFDEPFADSSQIPTILVAALAADHVKVALSGDGGDEVFGGYSRYVQARTLLRLSRTPRGIRRGAAALVRSARPETWDAAFGVLNRILPSKARISHAGHKAHKIAELLQVNGPRDVYSALVSQWQDPATVVLGGREPATVAAEPPDARIDDVSGLMFLDTITYLPDDILTKVDRATMAVGLEARVPLLDPRLLDFAWRLPLEMRIRGGESKWLLRRVLDRYVPASLVSRPKMGFGVPIGEWLRGPLRPWAEELLDESGLRDRGFLDPAPIRAAWAEHLSGRRDRKYQLWGVLMFQAWLESTRLSPAGTASHL